MYGITNCIVMNNNIHLFGGKFENKKGKKEITNKHLIIRLWPKDIIVYGYSRLFFNVTINDILQIIIEYYASAFICATL